MLRISTAISPRTKVLLALIAIPALIAIGCRLAQASEQHSVKVPDATYVDR